MKPSILLRLLCLTGVLLSAAFYVQIRKQQERIEDNLNQSRQAYQEKVKEGASLRSRALQAESKSGELIEKAEAELSRASGLEAQFDDLEGQLEIAEAHRKEAEEEVARLGIYNRDLQREVNQLKAAMPPRNWREQLNRLQSRLLELEAENTSLKKTLSAVGARVATTGPATGPTAVPSRAQAPVGEVVRIGPDGSFAILDYGRQAGAAEDQVLAIHRGAQPVAVVSVTQITNDFCIAQILSSTNTGGNLSVPDIQIGDTAHLE